MEKPFHREEREMAPFLVVAAVGLSAMAVGSNSAVRSA
jgi:hypothetical protein